MKYLTLIRTIALLHQYQRPVQTVVHGGQRLQYIEVTVDDIAVANRLAHQVLGRSLDELPPQTRRLLLLIDEMVSAGCRARAMERADYRFTRRKVREATGWGATQTRIHLDRLVELEYVAVHRGGRGQGFVYELAYDGQGKDGGAFLVGLASVESLTDSATTETWRGKSRNLAGDWRADGGPVAGGWRDDETAPGSDQNGSNRRNGASATMPARIGESPAAASYVAMVAAAERMS